MDYAINITIETTKSRQDVGVTLDELVEGGPFAVTNLRHVSPNLWTLTLEAADPGLEIGFVKAAQFLGLLAHKFEVLAVERTRTDSVAAAS